MPPATVRNVAEVLGKRREKVKENEVRPRVASLVGDRIRPEEKEKEKENREAKAKVLVERVLRSRLGSHVFFMPEATASLEMSALTPTLPMPPQRLVLKLRKPIT